eukprot:scaffold10225_cov66-Phaeocystis_antarctica.AAC.1
MSTRSSGASPPEIRSEIVPWNLGPLRSISVAMSLRVRFWKCEMRCHAIGVRPSKIASRISSSRHSAFSVSSGPPPLSSCCS